VAGSNVGSIRVLEKCGFVAVGSRTEHDENFETSFIWLNHPHSGRVRDTTRDSSG
jgi:RimJ/RimL family protein N-acetyltransferase